MAGRGPAPKDPGARQRRNAKSTKTSLERPTLRSVEDLADLTVAELRDMIAGLNAERPADQQIDDRGRKAQLAERIIAAESPIPPMPKHPDRWDDEAEAMVPVQWHEQTVAWWNDQWTSPMTSAWDPSDYHNVCIIALAYDLIWAAPTTALFLKAEAEFRNQAVRLGMDPVSRARLQWSIETADAAKASGDRRRQSSNKGTAAQKPTGTDPRDVLTLLK